jgi:hypothetical protein
VFVAYKNIVCTLKWASLKAQIGKTKISMFGRIDSWGNEGPKKFQTLFEWTQIEKWVLKKLQKLS